MSIDLTRQSGIIPTDGIQSISVCIVGAGAIGSHVADALTKMGVTKIRIYDDDIVSPENIAPQGFGLPELGMPKVLALKNRLEANTGAEITAIQERVEAGFTTEDDILISAVDSMPARQVIYDGFTESPMCDLFVDGRMGARYAIIFGVPKDDPERVERYAKTLHSEEEGMEVPCTEKATIFCAQFMASIISSHVAKHVIGESLGPFRLDMDLIEYRLTRYA